MSVFLKNWKSTIGGIGAAMVLVGTALKVFADGDPSNDSAAFVAMVSGLWALYQGTVSRDADKSSKSLEIER